MYSKSWITEIRLFTMYDRIHIFVKHITKKKENDELRSLCHMKSDLQKNVREKTEFDSYHI